MSDEIERNEVMTVEYVRKPFYTTEDVRIIIGAKNTSTVRMARLNKRITALDMSTRDLFFSPEEVQRFAAEDYNINLIFTT